MIFCHEIVVHDNVLPKTLNDNTKENKQMSVSVDND